MLLSAPQYYFICLSLKSGSPTQMSQKPPFLPGMHVAAFFCTLVRMSSEPSPGIDPSEWGWASGRRGRKERSWAVSIRAVSPQCPATLSVSLMIALVALWLFEPRPFLSPSHSCRQSQMLTKHRVRPRGNPFGTGGSGAKARPRVRRSPARSRAGFELGLRDSKVCALPAVPPASEPPVTHVRLWPTPGLSAFALRLLQLGLRPVHPSSTRSPSWNGHRRRSRGSVPARAGICPVSGCS